MDIILLSILQAVGIILTLAKLSLLTTAFKYPKITDIAVSTAMFVLYGGSFDAMLTAIFTGIAFTLLSSFLRALFYKPSKPAIQ